MIQPIVYTDFYKTDHRSQYPKGTELVYSNFTSRKSRIEGVDKIVVFGIQYFLDEYLNRRFGKEFFLKSEDEVVLKYKRRLDNALGHNAVDVKHIRDLHSLGYLPLHIKALPEGTRVPIRVPILTIKNTHPDFFWLTNFMETLLSNTLWCPMTSATIAFEYRKLFYKYATETSDNIEFVNWQGHDFSMRGMSSMESACLSGAAHLLSFTGTDTIPAIDFLEEYYEADSDKELIGGSVPATEHSVMCLGGNEEEIETFKRLITQVYPKGLVSIVSDTWDYWKVLKEYLPKLKDIIMSRNGKVVIRPDSGDPVEITLKSVPILYEIFGGLKNSKGYIELDPHIGLIYGDSITLERANKICHGLKELGFASTNVVFGIGSYTYQHVTRDTFGFAMKATYGVVKGESKSLFKKPVTDDGEKFSAIGLLKVTEDLKLHENVSSDQENEGLLKTVYLNGSIVKPQSLKEIRKRLLDTK